MHLGIAVTDAGFTSGVASVLDVFRAAEALRHDLDPAIPRLRTSIHGARRSVRTTTGVVVPVQASLTDLRDVDVVLVSAFGQLDADELVEQLQGRQGRALLSGLGRLPAGQPIAAACTGTFALAEVGMLDERRATTSWWLSTRFRARYPRCTLDMESMVVRDEHVTTAGAAFGHVDLALNLLRDVSPTLADAVARFLLIDLRPSQSSYAAVGHLAAQDELVSRFERHIRAHLAEPADMGVVARAIGASRRTLERRVRAVVGTSPLGLVHRIRVERARHLFLTTDRSSDDIAREVGYLNATTLRALMRRWPP
ncbi:MAG: GlxA family transcriptional regulator [Angustibacter sp.]